MKNATLSVLLMLLLGVTQVGMVAAQADEPEGGDAPSEPAGSPDDSGEPAEGAEAAPEEAADDAAPTDDAAADVGDVAEDVADDVAEEPVEAPSEETASPVEAVEAPVEAPAEEATEEEPETGSGLDTPEEDAPAEEEEAAAPTPAPWRNTFFNYTNQASFNSFVRDGQLSYNPVWQMAFSVLPRWYVPGAGFFRANVGFTLEVTDTDSNALNREPLLNDILIDYVHMIPWEGFIFMPNARVGIPTSRLSQATQRYFSTALGLTLVRVIPEVANLTLAAVFRYTRWWGGSNVVQVGEPQPDRCPQPQAITGGGGTDAPTPGFVTCDQLGTSTAASDVILAGLSATLTPIGGFSINFSGFMFTTQGWGLADAEIEVETSEEPLVIQDGSPNHFRNFTYFALSVAYQFTPWLNMSLGIQNSGLAAPLYNPDGSVRNPIFTPDTQAFLTATIGIDTLVGEIAGGEGEDLTPEERQRRQQGLAQGRSAGGTF